MLAVKRQLCPLAFFQHLRSEIIMSILSLSLRPLMVFDASNNNPIKGVLLRIVNSKFETKSNENGEFEFTLPMSKKVVKFRLLTGRDELDIDAKDEIYSQRNGDGISACTYIVGNVRLIPETVP